MQVPASVVISFSALVVALGGFMQMYNELSSVETLYQLVIKAEKRKRRGIKRLFVYVKKKQVLELINNNSNNSNVGDHLSAQVETHYMRSSAWLCVILGTTLGEILTLGTSVNAKCFVITLLAQLALIAIAVSIISYRTRKLDNYYKKYYENTLGIKSQGAHQRN